MQAKYGSETFLNAFAATPWTCPSCLDREAIQSEPNNPMFHRPSSEDEKVQRTTPSPYGFSKRSLTASGAEQELNRTTHSNMGDDNGTSKEEGGAGAGDSGGRLLSDV